MQEAIRLYTDQLEITVENGKKFIRSEEVARLLERRHSYIVETIRHLPGDRNFMEQNFREKVKYNWNPIIGKGVPAPYFLLTEAGFMYLMLNWKTDLSQRMKLDFVNSYFQMRDELERIQAIVEQEPYRALERLQTELANMAFQSNI